jgi:hypothetical protein
LAACACSVLVVVGWVVGAAPFWPVTNVTLSEAAALKDAGEVVRLITREHHDPNRAWPIREGVLGPAREMTPLEAAVTIRRLQMVRVLLRYGAVLPAGERRVALICAAVTADAPDIVEFLLNTGDRTDPRHRCRRLLPLESEPS